MAKKKETRGDEPELGAKLDKTAKNENPKQDVVESRNHALRSGHRSARENAEQEAEDQPAPAGE